MRIRGERTVRGADDEEYAALFDQHAARIYAYARRQVGPSDAQDVVADTFLVAWRRRSDVPADALPWLLVVARNTIANGRRRTRRERSLVDRVETLDRLAGLSAEDDVVERQALIAGLAELGEHEREALLLVAWDGLAMRDAARVAGCSQRAFEVRLSRARARLARAAAQQHDNDEKKGTVRT